MEKLNSTSVYVLSIISFICCCFGGLGIFLAGPAFIMANKKLKEAEAAPNRYEPSSVNAMKTAKIVALIALIINAVYFLATIYRLTTTDWNVFIEQYKQILEQSEINNN